MNLEFDEVVRDSMTWFTDGVEVPPGLAADARRHLRRRRRVRMGWIATGTAVAGVTAVLIGTVGAGSLPARPGPKREQRVTVQTTAMVISRVERALANAAAGDPVAYTRQTSHGVKLFVA